MAAAQAPAASRADKSLGVLTAGMLQELPEVPEHYESWEMKVDDIQKTLGAKLGAVYDVLQVLDSLLIVTRIGNGLFRYNGFGALNTTLAVLRMVGYMMQLPERIARVREQHLRQLVQTDMRQQPRTQGVAQGQVGDLQMEPFKSGPEQCQVLMMILLLEPPDQRHDIQFLARVILDPNFCVPESRFWSKAKRLHDFANIIGHLKRPLLHKVSVTNAAASRRTFVQYCGPDLSQVQLSEADIYSLPMISHKSRRFFTMFNDHLGMINLPDAVSGLITVRRCCSLDPDVKTGLQPVEGGFYNDLMTLQNCRQLNWRHIALIESSRLHFRLKISDLQDPSLDQALDNSHLAILPTDKSLDQWFSRIRAIEADREAAATSGTSQSSQH